MSKQFIEGNTYVFTKKNFIKEKGQASYKINKTWVKRLNGRTVDISTCYGGEVYGGRYIYHVVAPWCKCIKEGVKS